MTTKLSEKQQTAIKGFAGTDGYNLNRFMANRIYGQLTLNSLLKRGLIERWYDANIHTTLGGDYCLTETGIALATELYPELMADEIDSPDTAIAGGGNVPSADKVESSDVLQGDGYTIPDVDKIPNIKNLFLYVHVNGIYDGWLYTTHTKTRIYAHDITDNKTAMALIEKIIALCGGWNDSGYSQSYYSYYHSCNGNEVSVRFIDEYWHGKSMECFKCVICEEERWVDIVYDVPSADKVEAVEALQDTPLFTITNVVSKNDYAAKVMSVDEIEGIDTPSTRTMTVAEYMAMADPRPQAWYKSYGGKVFSIGAIQKADEKNNLYCFDYSGEHAGIGLQRENMLEVDVTVIYVPNQSPRQSIYTLTGARLDNEQLSEVSAIMARYGLRLKVDHGSSVHAEMED